MIRHARLFGLALCFALSLSAARAAATEFVRVPGNVPAESM